MAQSTMRPKQFSGFVNTIYARKDVNIGDLADAAPTNGNFDFVILAGESIDVVATGTTINFEELDALSDALSAIYISQIEENL